MNRPRQVRTTATPQPKSRAIAAFAAPAAAASTIFARSTSRCGLVAGDKSGKWNRWYVEAIPRAEQLYEVYLKERAEEESGR